MKQDIKLSDDALLASADDASTRNDIVMVNLLCFRENADYSNADVNDTDACSGREAYSKYVKKVIPLILEVGGYPVWAGSVSKILLSPDSQTWDQVALIAYPSRQAFVDMHRTEAYLNAVQHRNAGLASVRLIETKPQTIPRLLVRLIGVFFRLKLMIQPRKKNPLGS